MDAYISCTIYHTGRVVTGGLFDSEKYVVTLLLPELYKIMMFSLIVISCQLFMLKDWEALWPFYNRLN